jgi:hypothetical protein
MLATTIPISLTANASCLWVTLFKLCGMDIDYCSMINALSFRPSIMDLISIRRSFVGNASFADENDTGTLVHSVIEESSIGNRAHIAAGVSVRRQIVPLLASVEADSERSIQDRRNNLLSKSDQFWLECKMVALYLVTLVVAFASSVPSLKLCRNVLLANNSLEAVLGLSMALGLQSALSLIHVKVLQYFVFEGIFERRKGPVSSKHSLYTTVL